MSVTNSRSKSLEHDMTRAAPAGIIIMHAQQLPTSLRTPINQPRAALAAWGARFHLHRMLIFV